MSPFFLNYPFISQSWYWRSHDMTLSHRGNLLCTSMCTLTHVRVLSTCKSVGGWQSVILYWNHLEQLRLWNWKDNIFFHTESSYGVRQVCVRKETGGGWSIDWFSLSAFEAWSFKSGCWELYRTSELVLCSVINITGSVRDCAVQKNPKISKKPGKINNH